MRSVHFGPVQLRSTGQRKLPQSQNAGGNLEPSLLLKRGPPLSGLTGRPGGIQPIALRLIGSKVVPRKTSCQDEKSDFSKGLCVNDYLRSCANPLASPLHLIAEPSTAGALARRV